MSHCQNPDDLVPRRSKRFGKLADSGSGSNDIVDEKQAFTPLFGMVWLKYAAHIFESLWAGNAGLHGPMFLPKRQIAADIEIKHLPQFLRKQLRLIKPPKIFTPRMKRHRDQRRRIEQSDAVTLTPTKLHSRPVTHATHLSKFECDHHLLKRPDMIANDK